MKMVHKAEALARLYHAGQKRINGDPYITHPERVAKSLEGMSPVFITVGWLHDIIEDTQMDEDGLRRNGFPEAVIRGVSGLTRQWGETYPDFIKRCGLTRLTRVVKIADIKDNLRDVDEHKPGLRKRYEAALEYLEGIDED